MRRAERDSEACARADRKAVLARQFAAREGRAIAERRGYGDWTVDHAGWVGILMSPEEQESCSKTPEEALAWCLAWLMAPGLGIGPFLVSFAARSACGRC